MRAPKAQESAGGERRAQRAFRRRRKRFREAESSLCYYGQFLSPSSHVTCQNWIRPFTKKHRFIAQIDSARSNIASTAWRPCGLSPDIGYRVPENVLHVTFRHWPWSYNVLGLHDHGIGSYIGCNRFQSYANCTDRFNILCFDIFSLFQSIKLPDLHHVQN